MNIDHWMVIGWIVLIAFWLFVGVALLGGVGHTANAVYRYTRYLKTRNIPPATGQRWVESDGSVFEIQKFYPAGHFLVRAGSASWSETPEEWKQRVRGRKLILMTENER